MNREINAPLLAAYRFHRRTLSGFLRLAPDAMRLARNDVANAKPRYAHHFPLSAPSCVGTWRNDDRGQRTGEYYIEKPKEYFRFVGDVQSDCGVRNGLWSTKQKPNGWFTACDFQDETVYGVVYQTPARKGLSRFISGVAHSYQDGVVLCLRLRYAHEEDAPQRYHKAPQDLTAARDAAHQADNDARICAENSIDINRAASAGVLWSNTKEENNDLRAELKTVLKERGESKRSGALLNNLDNTALNLIESIADNRDTMEKLASGDHEEYFFSPRNKKERDAFLDGSGLSEIPS